MSQGSRENGPEPSTTAAPRLERFTVAGAAAAVGALVLAVGLSGIGLALSLAALSSLALAGAALFPLARRLPPSIDGLLGRRRGFALAWCLLALGAVGQTARLSWFMLDPAHKAQSVIPGDPWYVAHCCLTAYSEAARLAEAGEPNIYDVRAYLGAEVAESSLTPKMMGPFNIDLYHYPPPFLLLPHALRLATGGDFVRLRAVWYGLSGLALLAALGLVASRLEPAARLRAIFAAPAVWVSVPAQIGLQMSNFQILVVSISGIAWALLPRRRILACALLAFGAVAKIFPGLLALYLLLRGRYRAAAWTAAFGVAFALAAVALFGWTPFDRFLHFEMPRLSSGEAFARPFSRPFAVAFNVAPFGIPLKLEQLGLPGMEGLGMRAGRVVSIVYALAVVLLAWRAARRAPGTRAESAAVWLALLSLATLVSPFAPANYVLFSLVWLVMIDGERIRPPLAVLIWFAICLPYLVPREGPFLPRMLALVPAQLCAIFLPMFVLWRAGARRMSPPAIAAETA